MVVKMFWLRGAVYPSRYGVVVVRTVVSCLEGTERMGMDVRVFGCGIY